MTKKHKHGIACLKYYLKLASSPVNITSQTAFGCFMQWATGDQYSELGHLLGSYIYL